MRKQQMQNAAHELATQVRTVEDSIEAALAEIAELQAKMIHARAVTRAGFVNSHAAFEQVAATVSSLVAARGGIGNCHAALVDTQQTIPGLRTVAFGEPDECPPKVARADLRIVA